MVPAPVLDRLAAPAARGRRLIGAFRDRVLAAFPGRIERIVLFGSRARGDQHAESDWDLVVFFDHEPSDEDRRRLGELSRDLGSHYGAQIQAWPFAAMRRLDADELACNVREQGVVLFGSPEVPMVERPVLQHARDALEKAQRFAA